MSEKYPRTPHLPFSEGATRDDRVLASVQNLLNRAIVLTEKMDGSNVCLEADGVYARSHNGPPVHPSFDALKSLYASLKSVLPPGRQFFGEWLWAQHSLAYDRLPAYLLLFGVRDTQRQEWLSWAETVALAQSLGLQTVPVLWEGICANETALRQTVLQFMQSPCCGAQQEGVVARVAQAFPDAAFEESVAKCVRANHVQTTQNWSNQAITRNRVGNAPLPADALPR